MKSYFVFLSRHKLYTAIQAFGLIISIAFIILIANYVWQQYSVAYSNKYWNRVYAVGSNEEPSLSTEDKKELETHLPIVEAATRLAIYGIWVNFEAGAVEATSIYADPGFFEIFPEFELIEGDKRDFISETSCVISESFAKKYFHQMNPIGENIPGYNMKITGVYRLSGPSVAKEADIIYFMREDIDPRPFTSIGNTLTLIKVPENFDRETLLDEVTKVERPHYDENWIKEFKLYSLPELYFGKQHQLKKGDKALINVLLGVVILLLISSFLNYVNLSFALSGKRITEMATRRLMGSSKKGIILKNIQESIFFVFICGVFAISLAYIFLPVVDNLLINISIEDIKDLWRLEHFRIKWNIASIGIMVCFLLFLGFFAGLAPAVLSAKQQPIDIVKGTNKIKFKLPLSKFFICFQNILSILLISLAIVMESQLNHIYHQPLNARGKNNFIIYHYFKDYDDTAPLIDKISEIPGVEKIGMGLSYPGRVNYFSDQIISDDNHPKEEMAGIMIGNKNYFDIMDLQIIENHFAEGSNVIFISESLANHFRNEGISPERFFVGKNLRNISISSFGGVYKNIPTKPVTEFAPGPYSLFLLTTNENLKNNEVILVSVNEETLALKESILDKFHEYTEEKYSFPIDPIDADYFSGLMEKTLISVKSTIILLEIFMGLSVMISLLGLIAMSTYYANENTKGIAIRKVLGSDVKGEIWRNIRLYMILVVIAIAVAIPLAIFISREYLSRFAYRIENYWWIFIVASVGSLLIAFLSVYWQISRSAHINPATELKKE